MAKDPQDKITRIVWGSSETTPPPPDLASVQRESYEWFLKEGIREVLDEISPIGDFTGKNWVLTFLDYSFGKPKYSPELALEKGTTYDASLKVKAVLENKQTGERTEQEVFLGDLPQMTQRGTFIINGVERVVINQLVRSPGVYFLAEADLVTGRMLYFSEIRPLRGSWLEFSVSRTDILTVRIDRRRKFPATTFLRACGIGKNDEELLKIFSDVDTDLEHPYVLKTIEKDPAKSEEEAVLEIYRKMRPGDPVVLENAKNLLLSMFFNPRRYSLGAVGRFKLNKKLGLSMPNEKQNWVLQKEDLIGTVSYLIKLVRGVGGKVDDIDHLANRRLRRVGELVCQNAFRVGLLRLERVIKERMSLSPTNQKVAPASLVNAQPVISIINEFFRVSQLSQILDQTNPLSEIDNLRKLSVMGVGGISRERASFSIRDINHSQYGRICPVRTPEGPNVGLVTHLTLYSHVNEYGFLETPYRKVIKDKKGMKVTDEIVYLTADDEEEYYITHAGVAIAEDGCIQEERVPARFQGEFLTVSASEVSFIDLVPRQIVGISASLIPFLAHDDATRALMGTQMQCQAVPLVLPSSGYVSTGMERMVAENSRRVVFAREEGAVIFIDGTRVVVRSGRGKNGREIVYPVHKFVRSPQSTCHSQRPVVFVGQKVKRGDLLIDGPSFDGGELALGQNFLIAYASFEGLGYEDGIVISDRLVKEDILTSIHIEEHETSVVETKLGSEETTRDIPNVSEENLRNLDEEGIVVLGAEVGPGDILVGKIAPKGETELTAEERLLRAIFGEKAREVRDTSLRMPHGEKGTVIGVQILSREAGDELEPGTIRQIKVRVAQIRKVMVGDKLAGRHGNKGVISKIIPAHDMPYLEDGTPIDIIISPRSVLSRMNLGQLLEAHLGWAGQKLSQRYVVPVFEKIPGEKIEKELIRAGLPTDGKVTLYDGRTSLPYYQKVMVGNAHILKLIHMVEDKTHARSTGPYSLVTQQPLGGKAQMGGQRLGEMEVWALEAYGVAYTLQEMLTIKSDDVVGRAKAFAAIIKGVDIPEALIPESFKVLVNELRALCLEVEARDAQVKKEGIQTDRELFEEEKIKKEAAELAAQSGETTVVSEKELISPSSPMEIETLKEETQT